MFQRGRLTLARSVGWVRFPSGPLIRAHSPTERRQLGRLEIRVQFPVGPLVRKVAGYGWPGRFAKPCDSKRVVWVQIPCLPLYLIKTNSPMVKRTIMLRF